MAKSGRPILAPAVFLLGLLALGMLPAPALAAKNLQIVSFQYNQHFRPDESATISVRVKNNETTAEFAEVDVTLVSTTTGREFTLLPVLTGTIQPGETIGLSQTYHLATSATTANGPAAIAADVYTISFPLFDGNGDRSDSARGRFPIHIGTETESLRVFPEAIHLGTIPPGRYMHPMPIEVRWSFFRFNRLRLDQPFTVRIYTDNSARYHGIPGAVRRSTPAGLVSMNGRWTIPLKIWCLNFGPDIQKTGWDSGLAGPPPVDDDDLWIGPPLIEGSRNRGSATWVRVPDFTEMTANPVTWRRLIGQEPHDDRFVSDANSTGDFTLKSPFTFYLATEAGAAAVEGTYVTTLVVELWNP